MYCSSRPAQSDCTFPEGYEAPAANCPLKRADRRIRAHVISVPERLRSSGLRQLPRQARAEQVVVPVVVGARAVPDQVGGAEAGQRLRSVAERDVMADG